MRPFLSITNLLRACALALGLLLLGVGGASAHDGPHGEHTIAGVSVGMAQNPMEMPALLAEAASVCQDGTLVSELRAAPHHPPGMPCLCPADCLCGGSCACAQVCTAHLLTALPSVEPVAMQGDFRAAAKRPMDGPLLAGRHPAPEQRPPLSV